MTDRNANTLAGGWPGGVRRCLVLVGKEQPAPARLLDGLARRGAGAVVVASAPSAMVHLARERAAAVIVSEPESQPNLAELAAAVRRYYPRTQLWVYREEGRAGAERGLSKMNGVGHCGGAGAIGGVGSSPAGSSPAQPATSPATTPDPVEFAADEVGRDTADEATNDVGVHEIGDALSSVVDDEATVGGEHDGEPLISSEELAMLLGLAEDEFDLRESTS